MWSQNVSACKYFRITLYLILGVLHELENGRLSDRYCIGTDTGCTVSNRISLCCIGENPDITCITADSAAVNSSHYTGRSKDICAPSPAARAPFDP